jgi:LuxR family maltose regulon positive regulatory protein
MARRLGAASANAVSSEPERLLATKLFLPQPPPGFVARRRLLDPLDEATAQGVVLVCAPAGSGKTALLSDWARRRQRPVSWLSLDPGDNDPARFWRHVATALDQVCPGIASWADQLLCLPASSFEGLVTVLINELADADVDTVLVLDDFHLVDSRPVHESVEFLVERRPQCLAVVLAGRADPPLPLARLRARAQLVATLPADLVRARPRLSLARAIRAHLWGRADDVEPLRRRVSGGHGRPRMLGGRSR